ncbi:MAG: hypothetical protein LPL29_13400 [Alphaproteobacteria bacterium]|nr:hypothetical protein [Alphaproteobacteria bacterium]
MEYVFVELVLPAVLGIAAASKSKVGRSAYLTLVLVSIPLYFGVMAADAHVGYDPVASDSMTVLYALLNLFFFGVTAARANDIGINKWISLVVVLPIAVLYFILKPGIRQVQA